MLTTIDTSKRVWRVSYRPKNDELGRRHINYVNAESEADAPINLGIPSDEVEEVHEIDPKTGHKINPLYL